MQVEGQGLTLRYVIHKHRRLSDTNIYIHKYIWVHTYMIYDTDNTIQLICFCFRFEYIEIVVFG